MNKADFFKSVRVDLIPETRLEKFCDSFLYFLTGLSIFITKKRQQFLRRFS